jgi:hypothetical protein
MSRKSSSFRVGLVHAYLRGRIRYLCYHEDGKRNLPRVEPGREAARQLDAQTNAQLELGVPAVLSFEPIAIRELRDRWLRHHEQVLRSSVATIGRYRTATDPPGVHAADRSDGVARRQGVEAVTPSVRHVPSGR